MKRQATDARKYFKITSEKGLVLSINKELLQLNKKTTQVKNAKKKKTEQIFHQRRYMNI